MRRVAVAFFLGTLLVAGCSQPPIDEVWDGADETAQFRVLQVDDLCQNARIYVEPNREWFLGVVFAEVDLVEDEGGSYPQAIMLNGNVDGQLRSVYRQRSELLGYFVRTGDPEIADCSHFHIPRTIRVSENEIGPSVPLQKAGPAWWQSVETKR